MRGALAGALAALLLALALAPAGAQPEPTGSEVPAGAAPLAGGPVLLIMDASGSMNADDGTGQPKIEAARQALLTLIDQLGPTHAVGLRAYGHRTPNTDREAGCADTELLVPVATGNAQALREAVTGLRASGFTPIGLSLQEAVADLPEGEDRTVVLVSDGIDTCAPPPACDTAAQIVAEGVQLRVEAIGFQVDAAAADELRCIAEVTGGTYRPAESAEDLARELRAYVPQGTPVEGGPTALQATDVAAGQYLDDIGFPQERWYGIDLQPGDRVRATAAVIGDDDTPAVEQIDIELVLGFGDVVGITPCATDSASGIGPFTTTLAVDGLQVEESGTVCGDPGRYVIGLRTSTPTTVRDPSTRQALEDLRLPVELFVAVTSTEVAVEAEPVVQRPAVAPPPPADPGRRPTPAPYYLVGIGGAGLLGALIGTRISKALGP